MLSTGAFNALLKTLDEPPEHVKFILATTEPQKLPATILSRCQRFDFKRISNEDIIKRLKIVCNESNIEISEGALNIIATLSEGAMRDALSILERCVQDGENKIDEDKIKDLVGIPKITFVHDITKAIIEYNIDDALKNVNKVLDDGKDITNLLWEIVKYIKDMLVYKACNKLELYSEEEIKDIQQLSKNVSKERLISLVYELSELENNIKWSTQKTIMFQAGIIKLCNRLESNTGSLEERIEKIEKYLKSGNVVQRQVTQNPSANTYTNSSAYAKVETNVTANIQPKKPTNINRTQTVNQSNQTLKNKCSNNPEEYWPQILNELKQNGKIVLYTNLVNTKATQINDMTVGIEFPRGLTSFGRTILEKQENVKELTNMVSMASGKTMQVKYITNAQENKNQFNREENIQNFANESDIPFNII